MPTNKTIVVNTRFLIKDKLEGIGYFTLETMKRIVAAHPDYTFHYLFDRAYDPSFITAPNIRPVVLFPQARHPLLWYWWFQWSVSRYLKKTKPILFLSPDGYLPLNTDTPAVAVQHDIAFVHYPKGIHWLASQYYHYFVTRFLQKATRVCTVSAYSKQDIVQTYGISPDKIDVVYSAAKPDFVPISDERIKADFRTKYADGEPYFVYVGAVHPRKNVISLLRAFELFKNRTAHPAKLLIAGAMGWQNEELAAYHKTMTHHAEVRFLGRMALREIVSLIGSSVGLVYVSLFEGFGVPPLEGMACGVPVISANVTSIPEVCGDAALLVSPTDISAIADALQQLVADEQLARDLVAKGRRQYQQFTWDKTAELLWLSCEKAMQAV